MNFMVDISFYPDDEPQASGPTRSANIFDFFSAGALEAQWLPSSLRSRVLNRGRSFSFDSVAARSSSCAAKRLGCASIASECAGKRSAKS
jgi:hypothetical protein